MKVRGGKVDFFFLCIREQWQFQSPAGIPSQNHTARTAFSLKRRRGLRCGFCSWKRRKRRSTSFEREGTFSSWAAEGKRKRPAGRCRRHGPGAPMPHGRFVFRRAAPRRQSARSAGPCRRIVRPVTRRSRTCPQLLPVETYGGARQNHRSSMQKPLALIRC